MVFSSKCVDAVDEGNLAPLKSPTPGFLSSKFFVVCNRQPLRKVFSSKTNQSPNQKAMTNHWRVQVKPEHWAST